MWALAVLLFAILAWRWISSRNYSAMNEWAVSHSYKIESIEHPGAFSDTGPFHWNSKTSSVYKVTMAGGKVVWFRYGNYLNGEEVVENYSVDF
jgi:hypothetical protein